MGWGKGLVSLVSASLYGPSPFRAAGDEGIKEGCLVPGFGIGGGKRGEGRGERGEGRGERGEGRRARVVENWVVWGMGAFDSSGGLGIGNDS